MIDAKTQRAVDRARKAQARKIKAQDALYQAQEAEDAAMRAFYDVMTNRAERGLSTDISYTYDDERMLIVNEWDPQETSPEDAYPQSTYPEGVGWGIGRVEQVR